MTMYGYLHPHARNYRFGWTSDINLDTREFAPIQPSYGPVGARGIIVEYNHIRSVMSTTYWTCRVWEGDTLIAGGPGLPTVRDLIAEYRATYHQGVKHA